jgi:hypothetical protein
VKTISFRIPHNQSADRYRTATPAERKRLQDNAFPRFKSHAMVSGAEYQQETLRSVVAGCGISFGQAEHCMRNNIRIICTAEQFGLVVAHRANAGKGFGSVTGKAMDVRIDDTDPTFGATYSRNYFICEWPGEPEKLVTLPGVSLLDRHVQRRLFTLASSTPHQVDIHMEAFRKYPDLKLVMTKEMYFDVALALGYPLVIERYGADEPDTIDVRPKADERHGCIWHGRIYPEDSR